MARHIRAEALEEDEPELNIASLIDIVFLLLIYFLVTTTIKKKERAAKKIFDIVDHWVAVSDGFAF